MKQILGTIHTFSPMPVKKFWVGPTSYKKGIWQNDGDIVDLIFLPSRKKLSKHRLRTEVRVIDQLQYYYYYSGYNGTFIGTGTQTLLPAEKNHTVEVQLIWYPATKTMM